MTEEQKDQAQAIMFNDFRAIDEIQNKIISAYESLGLLRTLKDNTDEMFRKEEEALEVTIDKLNVAKKGLQHGK